MGHSTQWLLLMITLLKFIMNTVLNFLVVKKEYCVPSNIGAACCYVSTTLDTELSREVIHSRPGKATTQLSGSSKRQIM